MRLMKSTYLRLQKSEMRSVRNLNSKNHRDMTKFWLAQEPPQIRVVALTHLCNAVAVSSLWPKGEKNKACGRKKWPVCGPYKKYFLLLCGRCNMQIAARPLQKEATVRNIYRLRYSIFFTFLLLELLEKIRKNHGI